MENPDPRRRQRRWPPRVKRRGTDAETRIPSGTDRRPGPTADDDAAPPR